MPNVSTDQIPDLVKIAILRTTGDRHPNPATVDEAASMSDFGFTFFNYSQLTIRFDQIAATFNSTADIREIDIENCDTVLDCVKLVQGASKQ
jgi:hypothetical protein